MKENIEGMKKINACAALPQQNVALGVTEQMNSTKNRDKM